MVTCDEKIDAQQRKKLIEEYRNADNEVLKTKTDILRKLEKFHALKVRDNLKEDSNLCVILSCPGEEELINDKVCVGDTGNNLETILKMVSEDVIFDPEYNSLVNSEKRYNYSIINSVEKVYFRKYNGAEAEKEDVEDENNIKRVKSIIERHKKLQYVLICGDNAELIYQKVKSKIENHVKISRICHLGWVGLRNQYTNKHSELKSIKSGSERDQKRLELVAKKIKDDFQ